MNVSSWLFLLYRKIDIPYIKWYYIDNELNGEKLMYRIKQFIWAITSSFKNIDYNLVSKYLNNQELTIFKKLKKSEQHHSIKVCLDAIKMSKARKDVDLNRMCKIALLHDVGKIEFPLNVIDKSLIVIIDKLSKGNLRKYSKYKRIDAYYNHPIKSKMILSKSGDYDNEFLEIIKNHHCILEDGDNSYLEIIKKCDDIN